MFIFKCPRCDKSVVVDEDMAGRTKKCPHCKADIAVPQVPHKPEDQAAKPRSIVRQLPSGEESKYGWYSLMFAFTGLPIYFVLSCVPPIFGLIAIGFGIAGLCRGEEKGWSIAGILLGCAACAAPVLQLLR
jgi:DNA-directed RNA polymerase subunit RPC12/RpoP